MFENYTRFVIMPYTGFACLSVHEKGKDLFNIKVVLFIRVVGTPFANCIVRLLNLSPFCNVNALKVPYII